MAARVSARKSSRVRQRGNLVAASLIGGAIILSGALFGRSSAPVEAATADRIVAEYDTVDVLFTSNEVPAGTRFRDISFKTVPFPKHQVLPGQLTVADTTTLREHLTLAPLPANFPILSENFHEADSRSNPVIDKIPDGFRAMTVKVDATSSVEGWAGSGATVDVLLVERDRTTVVAEKVRILSAERSVSPVKSGTPNVPSTVTLLVTQEQCLAVNTAIPLGKIAFALRSARDDDAWRDTEFTSDRLRRSPAESSAKPDSVTGFVEVRDRRGRTRGKFALSEGKWIRAEAVPEGFLMGEHSEDRTRIADGESR